MADAIYAIVHYPTMYKSLRNEGKSRSRRSITWEKSWTESSKNLRYGFTSIKKNEYEKISVSIFNYIYPMHLNAIVFLK